MSNACKLLAVIDANRLLIFAYTYKCSQIFLTVANERSNRPISVRLVPRPIGSQLVATTVQRVRYAIIPILARD